MPAHTMEISNGQRRTNGRDSRTQSIATRFTVEEEKALLRKSESEGKNLREWAREALLREARVEYSTLDMITEIVGLQLLFLNTLGPVARGERISAEQFQGIVQMVKTNKAKAADEMLSRRRSAKEN